MTSNNLTLTANNSYSQALYELAEESKDLSKVEDEVNSILKLIGQNADFRNLIKDPTIKKDELMQVVIAFSKKFNLSDILNKFLCFLVNKARLFYLEKILKDFLIISSNKKGEIIATINGDLKNILTGERVALNFVSHISGIATKTNMFVKKVGKKTKICCTRKTIPNLRVIQKYAVKLGGGTNHRFNLSDEYLIKDNHISSEKNFENLIQRAIKKKGKKKITVEVDNLSQLKRILGLKFDRILLDNMSSKNLKKAVKMSRKFYETEASGGINLKNVKNVSSTGVDRISIGSLTHSMNALDLKLEI